MDKQLNKIFLMKMTRPITKNKESTKIIGTMNQTNNNSQTMHTLSYYKEKILAELTFYLHYLCLKQ